MRLQSNLTFRFVFVNIFSIVARHAENHFYSVSYRDYVDLHVPSATCYLPMLCGSLLCPIFSVYALARVLSSQKHSVSLSIKCCIHNVENSRSNTPLPEFGVSKVATGIFEVQHEGIPMRLSKTRKRRVPRIQARAVDEIDTFCISAVLFRSRHRPSRRPATGR